MKPSHVEDSLKLLIKCQQPVFLWGPPGVGKSQVVRQVTRDLDLACTDVRAVLLDPVDLRGLPHINGDNRAQWATPDFLPQDGKGVLFLDELNAAPPLVQAACYQLVLDRKIGEYTLPETWAVIAAGNRESDRAVTHRMPSALANRFVHIEFEADMEDWAAWALNHGIQSEIIGFLRFRPALLHQFDGRADEKAFPSPRAWEFVSKILEQNPGLRAGVRASGRHRGRRGGHRAVGVFADLSIPAQPGGDPDEPGGGSGPGRSGRAVCPVRGVGAKRPMRTPSGAW